MAQTNVVVGCSNALKSALNEWAVSNNMSANEAARRAIASFISYDLEAEKRSHQERRGRPRKYTSELERKAAAAARAKESRRMARDLVNQFRRQQAKSDMQSFRKAVNKQYGES